MKLLKAQIRKPYNEEYETLASRFIYIINNLRLRMEDFGILDFFLQ